MLQGEPDIEAQLPARNVRCLASAVALEALPLPCWTGTHPQLWHTGSPEGGLLDNASVLSEPPATVKGLLQAR